MIDHKTLIASGMMAVWCASCGALAQEQSASTVHTAQGSQIRHGDGKADVSSPQQLQAVSVSGYAASLQKSLNIKRNADSIVDAISAEDVGKFPDTNVAESLSHLPGITVDRQFGEGEKVSILGTDPALNRVLLNGQTIASTSWGGDPNDPDSRSFNYSIIAPEVIGNAEVYKTPQARIDEGSIGGTVILHTRKPLDLKKNLLTGTLSYNENDRSRDAKPNASVLYNWKNDQGSVGVLASLMHSEHVLRREGVEIFGYSDIQSAGFPASVAAGKNGVYPTAINTSLFEQTRKRDGFTGALQWRPSDAFELNFTGLYVDETFDNVNQSRYGNFDPANATSLSMDHGIATQGAYADGQTLLQSYVRKTEVKTASSTLRADWHGDGWDASGQLGYTRSNGGAGRIYGVTLDGYSDYDYRIDHKHVALNDDVSDYRVHDSTVNRSPTHDSERYAQFDFDRQVDWGPVTQLLAGIKTSNHSTGQAAYYDAFPADPAITLEDLGGSNTPSGYLDGLSVSQSMKHWRLIRPSAIQRYASGQPGADILLASLNSTYEVAEQNRAAYLQADFSGDRYRGNLGVRYVHTRDSVTGYLYRNGAYLPAAYRKSYGQWLPSLNIAYDLRDDLTLRFAAAKVIARPRYADMTPYVNADDDKLTANSGNPELDPYKSTNYDASLEWYFAPNSVLAGEVFYRDISNYILQTLVYETLHNNTYDRDDLYEVTLPQNSGSATVKGISLTYQARFGGGFGLAANYTYSRADTGNDYNLPYNSKNTYNLSPYFEKGPWSARLTLGWRSAYFTQIGRLGASQMTDAFTELDATVSYAFNEQLKLQLDGTNLLDETYYSYNGAPDEPYYLYKNGRTYTASLHFKF